MAKLIYSAITSLDGYTEDADGDFGWSAPDEEVHAFVNDLERPIGTYLYGRAMYDVMAVWETMHTIPDQHPVALDYAAIWQAADKIVFSTTLDAVTTERTRIERFFDADAISALKATATSDITVGGANLAGQVLHAGLVDELHQYISPVVVGGGKHFLPDRLRLQLDLVGEDRFGNGVVHLHYRNIT